MDFDTLVEELEHAQAQFASLSASDTASLEELESSEGDVTDELAYSDTDFDDEDQGQEGDGFENYESDEQDGDIAFPGALNDKKQRGTFLQHLARDNILEQETRRWFLHHWKRSTKPVVHDIFLVLYNDPAAQEHEEAFNQFEAKTRISLNATDTKDYITHAYYGTKRNCAIGGNSNRTNPCKNDCFACRLLRGNIRKPKLNPNLNFGAGIYTSTDSDKANQYSRNVNRDDRTKAIFLCSVITGRKRALKYTNKSLTSAGPDRDSIVSWATGRNETVVYSADQIMPHVLITYSLEKTEPPPRPTLPLRHHGVYTIGNDLFPKALQMDVHTYVIVGHRTNGRDNQLWILEKDNGGWSFRNMGQPDRYLGLQQSGSHYNSAAISGVSYNLRVVWELQNEGNAYRIVMKDNNRWTLDLNVHEGRADGTGVTLWTRAASARQQLWTFDYVESWNGPTGSAQHQQRSSVHDDFDYDSPYRNTEPTRAPPTPARSPPTSARAPPTPARAPPLPARDSPTPARTPVLPTRAPATPPAMPPRPVVPPPVVVAPPVAPPSTRTTNVGRSAATYNPSGRATQVQQPVHNGVYTLVNAKFRTVMDLAKSGGRVFGFKALNGENQKWIFEQSDGGWRLRNKDDTTQYLGLEYGSFKDGTKLVPVHQSSSDIVIWEIKIAMHNSVRINPVGHFSKEIDLSSRGGATNRTNIVLYHHINNASNQRWELMYYGTV